ncbi:TPA: hypothetical protein N0F65_000095 [Lagenidium giganteum]|uniref:Mic1 domain-containing protein n=1 Tax=Lagenidium giganteum TaxID=4803 RepID=A0AAV2YLX5_9STRA|nr:TPA: hypothetical protein N0F65_000095 [Lagenidium giganteum]
MTAAARFGGAGGVHSGLHGGPGSVSGGTSGDAAEPRWQFHSRVPWPGVRGAKLLTMFTTQTGAAQAPYDVELCVPTAGHVAFVLVRRVAAAASASAQDEGRGPSAIARHTSTPVTSGDTGAGSPTPTPARVLFVVDAVPPRRTASPRAREQPPGSSGSMDGWRSSISGGSGLEAATTSGATLGFSAMEQQGVDELELVNELFASTTKGGKDGCVLAKAPLLAGRFDSRIVNVRFTRSKRASMNTSTKSTSNSTSGHNNSRNTAPRSTASVAPWSPLRCVVARDDGLAFVWEWSSDLHQWTFLNRFCFLENPNLKWTKPVAQFTLTELPATRGSAVDNVEIAWWSTEAKQEPKLCLRRIQFEQEKNSFRTELVVGNTFQLPLTHVTALRRSPRGLWIVSEQSGLHLRSSRSMQTLSLSWERFQGQDKTENMATMLLITVHAITGEALVLHRRTGELVLVTHKHEHDQHLTLRSLLTLPNWTAEATDSVHAIGAYQHLVLVLVGSKCQVYSTLTGVKFATLSLPTWDALTTRPPSARSFSFWSIDSGASMVGLWTTRGFWVLQTPRVQQIAAQLHTQQQNARAALETVKYFGASAQFDAARFALDVLERGSGSSWLRDSEELQLVLKTISNPGLLLAALADQQIGPELVDELVRRVTAIHQAIQAIVVNGRLPPTNASSDTDSGKSTNNAAIGVQHLTPANFEALHHLFNWVLLAKRKLTRLQTSAYVKGRHQLRARTMSALTSLTDESDIVAFSPLEDHESASLQMGRKLRPMSSLRFSAGISSSRHSKQWLEQLELFLLEGVQFKPSSSSVARRSYTSPVLSPSSVPNHLLFHEERVLADYHAAMSSFSKHMYFESMCRLYVLHEPASLLPFVRCIAHYCPRNFSLSGSTSTTRSHAERALTILPPVHVFTSRVVHEQAKLQIASTSSSRSKKKRSSPHLRYAPPTQSLLAYVELLCECGYVIEACRALLECSLYDACKERFLNPTTQATSTTVGENDDASAKARRAVQIQVYFALLEHCVKHRDAEDLKTLLAQRPADVSVLHVLRTLRLALPNKIVKSNQSAVMGETSVTVGAMRSVLLSLVQQRSSGVVPSARAISV